MVTTIAPGSPFVVREHGEHRLWFVTPGGTGYTGIERRLLPGEYVHLAVWKPGRRLVSRRSYVLRSGDLSWIDTHVHKFDFSRPPSAFGHSTSNETVWRNVFVGGPAWLRRAV
jgi:hypothetical protein